MFKIIFLYLLLFFFVQIAAAQTRAELENRRKELRRQIDDDQKILNSNNVELKGNLTELIGLSNNINLHDKIVQNLGEDLNILDKDINTIQSDIIKYDRLLDTLKQEYAKSMVYAYKNRGNYEFLNFIFSADNFNDAMKRIAYLKSYRNYREMQGENILRTQELRKQRLEDLGVSKQQKNSTLISKSRETVVLEEQKKKQDAIVAELQKKGKDINAQIAAKQRQMDKINSAVKAAIAKDIKDAEKRKAAEKAALVAAGKKKSEEDRLAAIKKVNDDKAAAIALRNNSKTKSKPAVKIAASKVPVAAKVNPPVTPIHPVNNSKTGSVASPVIESNKSDAMLTSDFSSRAGSFEWPVAGTIIQHKGIYRLKDRTNIYNNGITIAAPVGTAVKAVFKGVVILVLEIEEGSYVITIRHGEYYTTYSNISSPLVNAKQEVSTNQIIGSVAPNLDGAGTVDFQIAKGKNDFDPEIWLRPK